MKVEVQIGELVLEGFNFHDQRRIASAMRNELSRLVRENDLPQRLERNYDRSVSSFTPPPFAMPQDGNPRRIGVEIARSVYKSLRR